MTMTGTTRLAGSGDEDARRLRDLLASTGAFQYSPDRPFELASGATSKYYFDLRLLNGDPEGVNTVAGMFYRHMIRQTPQVRSVGGLESGSISIATAVSQLSYYEHEKDGANPLVTSFFVRKDAKRHGTRKLIEGRIVPPVAIVDDVVTSGRSAISAAHAIKEDLGCGCQYLLSVIFRGTDHQRRAIEEEIPLRYIFDKDQLVGRSDGPED